MNEQLGIEISRDYFTFSAAHFVLRPDGSREGLHGHNFAVKVSVERDLNEFGFVVDFFAIKSAILKITNAWNHKVLIPSIAKSISISRTGAEIEVSTENGRYVFPASDVVLIPTSNTTCEELARYVGTMLRPDLPGSLISIGIEESPGQGAYWKFNNADK
jgi:6-pyruvoyltetrahydropterin/6-carboxytetrahydropterin synthase